jgi:hypothetical protein
MNNIKSDFDTKQLELEKHLKNIEYIVFNCNEPLEGNSFYYHNSYARGPEMLNKQLNLFWMGTNMKTKVCEIGFNAGHSALLFLLGRNSPTPLNFTIFDIGDHSYVKPTLEYVKTQFSYVNFEYIEGDSSKTIPLWIKDNSDMCGTFDVVHVDGGHTEDCIKNDIFNASFLVKLGGYLIIDDTNFEHINKYVNEYLSTGNYEEVSVLKIPDNTTQHRIIKRVK